jgi:hypothetical protein
MKGVLMMKKTLRRAAAFLLCLIMTVGLLPVPAMADDGDVPINETTFPDPIFRLYVSENYDNGDGILSLEERRYERYLYLSDFNISSLKGIEFFPNLEDLDCSGNKLTTLDLSNNTALTRLDCYSNNLSTLNVSNNTALTYLNCGSNKLTALDVSDNTALTYLSCGSNKLTALNVSNNTALTDLFCSDNNLSTLDVSNNTELRYLNCSDNPIEKLDIRNNPKLINAVALGVLYRDAPWCDDYISYYLRALDYTVDFSRNTRIQIGSSEPPVITAQPKNPKGGVGNTVKISVSAQGSGLKYQWYAYDVSTDDRWKAVDGATGDVLTVAIDEDYDCYYFCEITNDGGIVCSKVATITVVSEPEIWSDPSDIEVAAGKNAEFSVDAWGEDLSYQWYCRKKGSSTWEAMSGKTKAKLSFTAEAGQNGNEYRCEVSNPAGKATSKAAKLTVLTKPKITTQPKSATVKAGKKATFKVKASGAKLQYQWYVMKKGTNKWTKLSGKTSATLKITAKKSMNGYKYRCKVYNAAGSVYSKTIKLKVK